MGAALNALYRRIVDEHSSLLQGAAARAILAPSVTRVLAKGNSKYVRGWLTQFPLSGLRRVRSPQDYKAWFGRSVRQLATHMILADAISKRAVRLGSGHDPRWDHAAKILCLFLREAVVFRRVLGDSVARRVEPLLYVPIDDEVIKRARAYGVRVGFNRIYKATPVRFYRLQNELGGAARSTGAQRVWFDDLRGREEPRQAAVSSRGG